MNTNIVILAGRLTRDVELKQTASGKPVAEVSIANNRKFTTESGESSEETTYVDVTVWGRTAETTAEFCKTGSPVLVTGRLSLDTWDDKDTGEKRRRMRVVAERIDFMGERLGPKADSAEAEKPISPSKRASSRKGT
ncbi:MAG: single-stranded DNA-binding protein [Chthoniobacteraceae bacterium]